MACPEDLRVAIAVAGIGADELLYGCLSYGANVDDVTALTTSRPVADTRIPRTVVNERLQDLGI
ncbi:MAG: hypothetical protein JO147_13315, partial [Actinobacteria bacterium]|nr:hypothetical protein [Actinomycetota bacterium]